MRELERAKHDQLTGELKEQLTAVQLELGDWYDSLSDEDKAGVPKKIVKLLEERDVGYDFNGYRDAPPSLRIWCGGTVETADVAALLPWLPLALPYGALWTPLLWLVLVL